MTDQKKALVRRDLALCLKLNEKLGDYGNRNAVQKVYGWIGLEPRFRTVIGKRYVKRLEEVLGGKTDFMYCVLCNGLMMDETAVCADCLQKYRNMIPQSAKQKVQADSDAVQKITTFSRQAANTAKRISVTTKDNFNTVSAKIGEFTEENETLSAAKDKLKEIAGNGIEKLQTNPEAAKVMEKGQEQAKKVRGKWKRMSRKKRIVIMAICVLLLFGGISGISDGTGDGGGISGGSSKIASTEDAMRLAETLYPETEGYRLQAGGKTTYDARDSNDNSKKNVRATFYLQVGENMADGDAMAKAYEKTDFDKDFTYYFLYIYSGYDHMKDCMISGDGRVVEIVGGQYIRVR